MTEPVDLPVGSQTVFRLPRAYWHCRVDNFDWSLVLPASLRTHYATFLAAAHAGGAPHLILTGEPGIGKTHLGVAAYRQAVCGVGTERATWVNVPDFCRRVKEGYERGGVDPFQDYLAAQRFVVLDDLVGRDLSLYEMNQIVYRLLDGAYQGGAAMLVTMNPPIAELAARFQPHEVSRLLADATVIPMIGSGDRRRP